jgi:hypothetical protein
MATQRTMKIENVPDFVRDLGSNAVINTDVKALQTYKERHQKLKAQQQETLETKTRLGMLENELKTLQSLVKELVTMRSKS